MRNPSVWGRTLRLYFHRLYEQITLGGDWAATLARRERHNLHAFFYDGLFASASDNIVITYLTFYLIALGASNAQIGILSSISSIVAAIMLLPGAFLVERFGRRKDITVWFGGGIARIVLLFLAILPLSLDGQAAVMVAIVLTILRDAFGNLAYPAWMAMIGEIVPLAGRGRYFGMRNFVMGIAGMATTLLMGEAITRMGQPVGYQLALGLAFVIGMISTYAFAQIHDPNPRPLPQPPPAEKGAKPSPLTFLRDIWQHPGFLKLSLTAIVWNFGLNIAGPFFSVYMARELQVTPTLIAVNSTVSTVASMAAQLFVSRWADRWGARRLQLVSGLCIPVLPFAWVFITEAWQIIPVNTIGGALWGVYGLASFNLLLELTPEAQRARYSALYQNVVTVALAGGAAFGSLLITHFGFTAVFLGSAAGRFLAALLFAWLLRPARPSALPHPA
jgi:MFS family permease